MVSLFFCSIYRFTVSMKISQRGFLPALFQPFWLLFTLFTNACATSQGTKSCYRILWCHSWLHTQKQWSIRLSPLNMFLMITMRFKPARWCGRWCLIPEQWANAGQLSSAANLSLSSALINITGSTLTMQEAGEPLMNFLVLVKAESADHRFYTCLRFNLASILKRRNVV